MKSGQGLCQAFIVAGQTAEAGRPGEAALDHPAARQQDETALGLGMFDECAFPTSSTGPQRMLITPRGKLIFAAISPTA